MKTKDTRPDSADKGQSPVKWTFPIMLSHGAAFVFYIGRFKKDCSRGRRNTSNSRKLAKSMRGGGTAF